MDDTYTTNGQLFCCRVIDEMGFWHFISQYDESCGVYFGRHDRDGSAIYTGDIIKFTDYPSSIYSDEAEQTAFENCAEVAFINDKFTLTNYKDEQSEVRFNLMQGMTFNWSDCKILKRKTIKDSRSE